MMTNDTDDDGDVDGLVIMIMMIIVSGFGMI